MGIRAFYGQALGLLRKHVPEVFAVSADLGRSSGLGRFAQTYPHSYLNVGIAEQNLVAFAAGLSLGGSKVYASSFAPFLALRAGEFLRMEMAYMQIPITVVALGSGVGLGYLGNSHYGLEDMAVARAIPGLRVLNPADATELALCLGETLINPAPTYIRLTGAPSSPVFFDEKLSQSSFSASSILPGKSEYLVVSTGTTSAHVKDVLSNEWVHAGQNYTPSLLHLNHVNELDSSARLSILSAKKIMVFEEHLSEGGVGSLVSQCLTSQGGAGVTLFRNDLGQKFLKQGSYTSVLEAYGLSRQAIFAKLLEFEIAG
ncbi:hypothetical protein N9N06_04145 [Aquiluna sp.]|nr:hypothetical protein [Aquiluna sp.]